MNILFLCHRIPYPPNKGDKIRSFNILKYLSARHDVYLGTTLDEDAEKEHLPTLDPFCKEVCAVYFNRKWRLLRALFTRQPLSVFNFYDKNLQAFVDRLFERVDIHVVFCFCSSMAEYVFRTPRFFRERLEGVNLIMDYVDLDSDKWAQYARYAWWPLKPIYYLEHRRLFRYEKHINSRFRHSIFVSEREVGVFRKTYKKARSINVVANGVDFEQFKPAPERLPPGGPAFKKNSFRLVFTGFMDYFANEDGVRWFCDKILPSIQAQVPDVEFYIAGNRPTNVVWSLSERKGVTVTGYVQDIRDFYWMADVCVIPLRIARGLQNKVLEAMATGNAVVATSNASEGIICHNNEDIVIADSEDAFARAVIGLIKDPRERKRLGGNAASNIRKYYAWEENLRALDVLFENQAEAQCRN